MMGLVEQLQENKALKEGLLREINHISHHIGRPSSRKVEGDLS